jgi:hypothetical protein
MASTVEVANGALDRLGAERIVSLTENSTNARTMNAVLVPIRDRLLRQHPWNFSIKRAQLAASSTAPAHTRNNAFPLPPTCLRLLPRDPEANNLASDWQIENHLGTPAIITNDSAPLDIRYVAQIADPNVMDALFVELWSVEMAFATCKKITGSNALKESLREDRKTILSDARRNNAYENVAQQFPDDSFITVRT